MKIRVDKLRQRLELLKPALPKKATLPIILSVLVDDGKIIATDLDNRVSIKLPEAKGSKFVLPYRAVVELLKYVKGDSTLTLEADKKSIKLTWDDGSAAYETKEAKDFPPTPDVTYTSEGNLNGDRLVESLGLALPYCATESARPVLTGVAVYLGDVMQIAGADGFRLSYQSFKEPFPEKRTIILDKSTIKLLEHLWQKMPAKVPLMDDLVNQLLAVKEIKLSLAEKVIKFAYDDVEIISQPISGTPPDHLALLHGFKEPVKLKVITADFLNAVRRVANISKDGAGTARLKWDEQTLTISAKNSDVGEISVNVPVLPDTTPGRIALNTNYLLSYLSDKEGVITMGKDDGYAPAVFHYGSRPVVAIMPMNVQWDEDKTETADKAEDKTEEPAGEKTEAEDEAEIPEDQEAVEPEAEAVGVTEGAATEQAEKQDPKPKQRGRRKKA